MMSRRLFNRLNRFVLFSLTISVTLFISTFSASAVTYTVPKTAEVKVSWDHNDPLPEGYRVYQRKSGQAYDYSSPVWTGANNSGVVYNLEYDTTYYFVVRAFEGTLESVDSDEVSFMAPTPAPATYSLSATASEHGAISPAGKITVAEGSDQTFTIKPHSNCHLTDVKVDGVSQGVISSYTFSRIAGNHTINATFSVDTYQITATAGANGKISPSGNRTVNYGASQSYTITAAAGYHVVDVRVDGVSVGPIKTYTFDNIDRNHSIYATFAANTFTISATAGDNGSITPAGVTEVAYASDQTYSIAANSGYRVADVVVDGKSMGAIGSYTFSNVTDDHTIAARFSEFSANSIQIEAEEGNLSWPMRIRDDESASAGGYIWVPTRSKEVAGYAEYHFKVLEAAEYVIWGRQVSNNRTRDSFFVSIDGKKEIVWHTKRGGRDKWTWDVVSNRAEGDSRDTANPEHFFLTAGTHTLKIKQRENGTKLDKVLITNQTEMRSPVDKVAVEAMEFGDVEINHKWTRVNYEKTFVNPAVVAGPISLNGKDPAVIRIQNIDSTGFDIRVQEWDYLDGGHATETVSYMVMEQGTYTLDDGTKIEAGNLKISAAKGFQPVVFAEAFNVTPIVMSTITSNNDSNAVTGRVKQVTTGGFSYRMQEQDANTQDHGVENLSYIAWEPSSGTVGGISYLVEQTADVVTSSDYDIRLESAFATTPVFLADMQTADGGDAATIRCIYKKGSSVGVLVDEEESRDAEVDHATEVVGYMVLSR